MPIFDTSDSDIAAAILQEDYLPRIQFQLNSDTVLSDRLERVPKHLFFGNRINMAAHRARGITHVVDAAGNMGLGAPTDTLPPRSKQDYATLTYDVVELAQRIGFSASNVMRTRNAPEGAFVELLAEEMRGARDDWSQERNRQFFGDGTGVIAEITVDTGAAQQTVDSTRFLRVGEPVVIATLAEPPADAGGTPDGTILSVDSGVLVTFVATVTSSSDFIWHRRSTSVPIAYEDMFGLQAIVTSANVVSGVNNIGELTRTANRFWEGQLLANSGVNRALSTRLLKATLNQVRFKSGKKPTIGITSDAILLEYGTMLVADRRFPADPKVTLDGGWEGLSFADVPIIPDKDAPPNTLFFLHEPDLMIAEDGPLRFEDRDGNVLFRVADKHQFEATLFASNNLVAKRCNSHGQLADITENNQTFNT